MPRLAGTASTTFLLVASLAACHVRGTAAPLLTSVTPSQITLAGGNAGLITVKGRGFDSLNTVHFGALRIPGVPRTSDSVMQFAAPTDNTFLPDRGPSPVQPLASGAYELRIQNTRGTSNAMTVTLIAGGIR